MSDDLLADSRVKEAESKAFDAENAECAGDHATARNLYSAAAELDLLAVLDGSTEPNNRSMIAEECVCLFARALRYDRAIEAAERILATPGALTVQGTATLRELLAEHRLVGTNSSAHEALTVRSNTREPKRDAVLFAIRDKIRAEARKQDAARNDGSQSECW